MALAVGVLLLAVVGVALVVSRSGSGTPDRKPSATPKPSLSLPPGLPSSLPTALPSTLPSGLPSEVPTSLPSAWPSGLPTELPSELPSALPTELPDPPTALPFYHLREGDCFDVDKKSPGYTEKRSCEEPHDAEAVSVVELDGELSTDAEVRAEAAALCEEPLRAKAVEQPEGTFWTFFVQYPYSRSYATGLDTVTCSLTSSTKAAGTKLEEPLL
ncbi:hypothetical protein ABT160_22805 [Streptomyces sp. NPDC001941]|uniref:hypothetical protein n=1 Tax=Streptomyces sp. NPDC001941 TaxID=3154659 RepID=UPI00332ABFE8